MRVEETTWIDLEETVILAETKGTEDEPSYLIKKKTPTTEDNEDPRTPTVELPLDEP